MRYNSLRKRRGAPCSCVVMTLLASYSCLAEGAHEFEIRGLRSGKALVSATGGNITLQVSFDRPIGLSEDHEKGVIEAESRRAFLEAIAKHYNVKIGYKLLVEGGMCTSERFDKTANRYAFEWSVPKTGVHVVADIPASGIAKVSSQKITADAPVESPWRQKIEDYETELLRFEKKVRDTLDQLSSQTDSEYDSGIMTLEALANRTLSRMAADAGSNPRLFREERVLVTQRINQMGRQLQTQIDQAHCRYE
jgi:hypothetical protein